MTLKAVFIYTDDLGRPVLRKVRRSDAKGSKGKNFRVQAARYKSPGGIYWKGEPGCVEHWQPEWASKVIYNLPVVNDALRAGDDTWLCEGERDSDLLMTVARLAATTTYQGIERITPEHAAWFVPSSSTVNILMDRDDAGAFGGWARYMALTDAGVRVDRLQLWRPAKGFKDVTEAVMSVGLRAALVRAKRGRTRDAAIRYGTTRAARYADEGDVAPTPTTKGA